MHLIDPDLYLELDIEELREGRHIYSVMSRQLRNVENISKIFNEHLKDLEDFKEMIKDTDFRESENIDRMIKFMQFQQKFQEEFVLNISNNLEPILESYALFVNMNNEKNNVGSLKNLTRRSESFRRIQNTFEDTTEKLEEITKEREEKEVN
ncbi:hypothetical protein [Staphylococcus warneri]|uniref:hypothetical protein n=1 Tax=Staphylococcus warneri TaxID=1292 RepID=UPI00167A7D49|nr:hypothetical protein [Staphylococcus warneri]